MRKLPLILTFALAATLQAPLALAQPGPVLPENLPAAPMLNDNQVKVIADFAAAHAAKLTSGDHDEVARARGALVAPLQAASVSVRFRLAYSQALGDALRAAIQGKDEVQAVNALRLAGELATPSAIVLITPSLTDQRPAVRFAATFAAARLFDAVARHDPAPSPEQLTKLIRDLRLPAEGETDPAVLDGFSLAFTAASRIKDAKFRDQNPSIRAVAITTLARVGTTQAQNVSKLSTPCQGVGPMQRALRAMRDALADVAQPPLPNEALGEVKTFTTAVIAAVKGLAQAQPSCPAESLEQASAAAESVRKLAGG
jgi:phage tail protein X